MSRLYFHPVRYACNKACEFCITKQQFNSVSKFPSYVNPYKLDDISEYIFNTYSEIEITGGGEPTMHPNFLDILKILSQYNTTNKKLYTKLYTNRTNMSILTNTYIDEITYSYENIDDFIKNINNISEYNIYAKQRARIYCKTIAELSVNIVDNSDTLIQLGKKNNLEEIILGLDFNEDAFNFRLSDIINEKIVSYFPVKLTIDLHEKECTKYNILYTDGLIYNTWDSLLCKKSN